MSASRRLPWAVAVVGVTAGLLAFQTKPAPPAPSPKAENRPALAEAARESPEVASLPRGPLRPVWEHFIVRDELAPAKPGTTHVIRPSLTAGGLLVEAKGADAPPDYAWPRINEMREIRFLIVTVPDPVDTSFGYVFDQYVDALQRAAEADHYVLDRAWLPWHRRPAGTRGATAGGLPEHHRHPGLLLFRAPPLDKDRSERLLAVCLVGETPTSGIHKVAFTNSLRLAWQCPPWHAPLAAGFVKADGDRVRVIGPSFSGSAESLRKALVEASRGCKVGPGHTRAVSDPPLFVVAGSATGFDRVAFCDGWADPRAPFREEDPRGLRATALPDELVRLWVYKYLDKPSDPARGEQPDRMAILRESNTGYGAGARPTHAVSLEEKNRVWDLPFPLHISQVRQNYTREQLARLEGLGLPRSSRLLPFPREDGADDLTEALPVQAPPLTTALNDMILNGIVATISKERIKYAGIVATDTRDRIFLAEVLHDRCPDVQLFLTTPELLLAHPDYNTVLGGAVVGSSYPLHLEAQRWLNRRDDITSRHLLFPSQSAQGYYNAALVHLGRTEKMLDYGGLDLSDAHPADHRRPAVWINLIGQNGQFVPLFHAPYHAIEAFLDGAIECLDPSKCDLAYVEAQMARLEHLRRQCAFTYEIPEKQAPPRRGAAATAGGSARPVFYPAFSGVLLIAAALAAVVLLGRGAREALSLQEMPNSRRARFAFTLAALGPALWFGWMASYAMVPLRSLPAVVADDDWIPALVVWGWPVGCVFLVGWILTRIVAVWAPDPGRTGVHKALRGWLGRRRAVVWLGNIARFFERIWRQFSVGIRRRLGRRGRKVARPLLRGGWYALGVLVALGVCSVGRRLGGPPSAHEVLAFDRALTFPNGVSPVVPGFFLGAALLAWGLFSLKKAVLNERYRVACPFPRNGRPEFATLRVLDQNVRDAFRLRGCIRQHPLTFGLLAGGLALGALRLHDGALPSPEGSWFDVLTGAGFAAAALLLLLTLAQFHYAWREVTKLLHTIAKLPMACAFDRLPESLRSIWGGSLFATRPSHTHLAISAHQLQRVRLFLHTKLQPRVDAATPEAGGLDVPAVLTAARAAFPADLYAPPRNLARTLGADLRDDLDLPPDRREVRRRVGDRLAHYSARCAAALIPCWPAHSLEEAFDSHHEADVRRTLLASFLAALPADHPLRDWVRLVEDFVAIEVVRYVSQFLAQLRNLMVALTAGSLLLVLAATLYPFHPRALLLLCLMGLTGTVAASMVVWLVRINRDELLSRIEQSTPNRFTPDFAFVHSVTTYVLPIVGVLLFQFPAVGSALRSVLDPILHTLH